MWRDIFDLRWELAPPILIFIITVLAGQKIIEWSWVLWSIAIFWSQIAVWVFWGFILLLMKLLDVSRIISNDAFRVFLSASKPVFDLKESKVIYIYIPLTIFMVVAGPPLRNAMFDCNACVEETIVEPFWAWSTEPAVLHLNRQSVIPFERQREIAEEWLVNSAHQLANNCSPHCSLYDMLAVSQEHLNNTDCFLPASVDINLFEQVCPNQHSWKGICQVFISWHLEPLLKKLKEDIHSYRGLAEYFHLPATSAWLGPSPFWFVNQNWYFVFCVYCVVMLCYSVIVSAFELRAIKTRKKK